MLKVTTLANVSSNIKSYRVLQIFLAKEGNRPGEQRFSEKKKHVTSSYWWSEHLIRNEPISTTHQPWGTEGKRPRPENKTENPVFTRVRGYSILLTSKNTIC